MVEYYPGPSGGFGFMFNLVPVFILFVFILVIAMIAVFVVNWSRNARAPRQTVYARVVAKRMDVSGSARMHAGDGHPHSMNSRTYYYITLEFDNGARREFLDVKNLYGLVVEGDVGYAAIKGDWIIDFERQTA